jgi:hypothetical protein
MRLISGKASPPGSREGEKSEKKIGGRAPFFVFPAEAGIQLFQDVLDPGFRRGDDLFEFLRSHQV